MSGLSGSGKTTFSVRVCINNKWQRDFLDFQIKREPEYGQFDALIIDNLFSTENYEREIAWLSEINARRIIITTRAPGGYEQLRRLFSRSNVNIKEFKVGGLPQEPFEAALRELCSRQALNYCNEFAQALFRQTGGLPIAIQLVWQLASRGLLMGRALSSLSDCSIEKLVEMFRAGLVRDDRDVCDAIFVLSNVPRFALSTNGLALVLDWSPERAERALASLLLTGLARLAIPSTSASEEAVRIHDLLVDCFAASDSESDQVQRMKLAHCTFWTKEFAAQSPVTMLDSLVVCSELLFSGHSPELSEASFLDGLRVMAVMSSIIDEITEQTVYTSRFPQFSDWISTYVSENYRCMTCHTVIPLALLCLRFPEPDKKIGEAFSLFWNDCTIDDATIVSSAVAVSALHLGIDERGRFRSALERISSWRMDQRELVAAAFANALARFEDHEWATYFVSGHNTGGIDCTEALAGILFALEQRGDERQIELFMHYHGWRCHSIDPVTAAFLKRRIGAIGREHYGFEIEVNMNRVSFLAKLFSHSEFEEYADSLLRRSEVVSESPPVHRVQRAWLNQL